MSIKYCLPIIKRSEREVFKTLKSHFKNYDFFEIWLDYIEDLSPQFIQQLKKKAVGKELIFLFRRQNLDRIKMPLSLREKLVKSFEKNDYLDLDITSQVSELNIIRDAKLKGSLITSYHNYKHTPDEAKLNQIIKKMDSYKPKIYKIATYCKSKEDALRLLKILLKLRNANKKAIVLGMGEYGKITRIFGTLWGNEMIFAPVKLNEKSAPGQLSCKQLKAIFREIL